MTATMTRPEAEMTLDERRAARKAALLASFNPVVPGITGDGSGVILHTDNERGLVYTWYDQSRRPRDFQSREDGYLVSRLAVTHGETEVAYLNVTHTTKELFADVFANAFEWADKNTGACFGFDWAAEKGETVSDAEVWATAYNDLRITPPSMVGSRCWTYSASDAPTDPKVLKAELAAAEKVYAKQMSGMVRFLSTPFVDFSRVEHDKTDENGNYITHGAGIGRLMYILAAQRLATQGKVLRASGCQTNYAQGLWVRLAADPTLPVRKTRTKFFKATEKPTQTHLCLDYTR